MNDDVSHFSTESADVLTWRMAADGLALIVAHVRTLVQASAVSDLARPLAERRIESLRDYAVLLLDSATQLEHALGMRPADDEFSRIVDGFWRSEQE